VLRSESPATAWATGLLGGVCAVALAVALLGGWPALVAPAAAALGAGYAVVVAANGGSLDLAAPLVAVALLLTCELAYWSHELRSTSPDEPGARALHAAWLALLALGSLVPGAALLVLAGVAQVSGIAVEAAGALAAAAAVAAVVTLARGKHIA
jgi:hypothetical protein